MPPKNVLAVNGYQELMRGLRQADKETRRDVRKILRGTGEAVRQDAALWIAKNPHGARSAAGLKVGVRQSSVVVRQSLRKTTGLHGEWGAWQMRRLVTARKVTMPQTERAMEHAMDQIADRFNRG